MTHPITSQTASTVALSERELIALVASDDVSGLAALYDQYSRPVFSLLLRMLQDQQLSEDLTQEVFLRVWQRASSFSADRGRLASWIFQIAHHAAVDEIRRRKSRPQRAHDRSETSGFMLEFTDGSPTPDELAIGGLQREAIAEALSKLPLNQREAIEMSYFDGMTQAEIAERGGTPLGTVKTRTRLGLQRMRDYLKAGGMEPDTVRGKSSTLNEASVNMLSGPVNAGELLGTSAAP